MSSRFFLPFLIKDFVCCGPFYQKYKEFEKSVRVEEIDGVKLVKNLAVKMEEMFRKKAEATRVSQNVLPFPFILSALSSIINEQSPINKMQK